MLIQLYVENLLKYKFNESITGLEDMELLKDISKIVVILIRSQCLCYHIHDESWIQTKTRYERESIALQK